MQPIDEPALTADLIQARADAVMNRLREAAVGAGRDPAGFRLVAVTKGFGTDVVRLAVRAGLTTIGENRVQEAGPKVEALGDIGVDWHLIGRLQANKARQAARIFSTVHSVDSLDLLRRLDRVAAEEGRDTKLLLQVNVTGEERKAGFAAGWFAAEARRRGELTGVLGDLGAVQVTGLMTMARFGASPDELRSTFAQLRALRDALEQTLGSGLPELSMGMTADAEAAVAEGSSMVRIGTAIFGPRPEH